MICMHGLEFEALEYDLVTRGNGHQLYSMDLYGVFVSRSTLLFHCNQHGIILEGRLFVMDSLSYLT